MPLKFGLDGVLYSMPLSDILTFLIAVFLICQTYKELSGTTAKSMEIGKKSIVMIEKSFETGEAEGGILNGIENAERYEADIRTMKST